MTVQPPPPPPPASGSRRRVWIIALAAVLVVAAGGVAVSRLIAAGDSLPEGMLTVQFPTVPTTSWVVMPGDVGGTSFTDPGYRIGGGISTGIIDAGEVMIVGVAGSPRGNRMIGVNRHDGTIVWDRELDGQCSELLAGNRIACTTTPDGRGMSRIAFISVDDGSEMSTTEPGPYSRVEQVQDTLVYSGFDDQGALVVSGGSAEDPAALWALDDRPSEGTRYDTSSRAGVAVLQDVSATGGWATVVRADGTLMVDHEPGSATITASGSVLVSSASSENTQVIPAGGGEPFDIPGFVRTPAIDVPGSAPHVLLADESAFDATTGERLWTSDVLRSSYSVAAVIGGLILVQDNDSVTALDVRDGVEHWSGTLPVDSYHLSTDGRRLFYAGPDGLTAMDVHDGTVLWSNLEGSLPTVDDPDEPASPDYETWSAGLTDALVYATPSYIKGYGATGPESTEPGVIDREASIPSIDAVDLAECPVITRHDLDVAATTVTLLTTRVCRRRTSGRTRRDDT